MRDLGREVLPKDCNLLVRGLGAALISIPAMDFSKFLYLRLAGKASLIQGHRIAVIFPVERARKDHYYYAIEAGKKFKLDDVFGTLLSSENDDVIFARPI